MTDGNRIALYDSNKLLHLSEPCFFPAKIIPCCTIVTLRDTSRGVFFSFLVKSERHGCKMIVIK